jgi:hypothetical protein
MVILPYHKGGVGMSNSLQIQKLKDLVFMESQNNNPTFVWNGATYNFLPSISEITRELEDGGFKIVKLLTASVRLYDLSIDDDLIPLFSGGVPESRLDIIRYPFDNQNYRIESVKFEKTGAYFRIVAVSTNKGI